MASKTAFPTGIRRIDNPHTHTHCWHVFIQRRGGVITRHFSDGIHGGEKLALHSALCFLREIDRSQPPLLRKEYADILRKNNTSGVPGVSRHESNGKKFWAARWPTGVGQSKSAKFTIRKYGEKRHSSWRSRLARQVWRV